jgi:hypothetical protein
MRKKRGMRQAEVYKRVCADFRNNKLPKEVYAGFYLYWAEGTKSAPCTVALTNSDPSMLVFFVSWLTSQAVPRTSLRIKLHLYADMNTKQSIEFWSSKLSIPSTQFYKPYIKAARSDSKTYKGMFGYGTCTVIYHNRDMYEYVMAVIKYLQEKSI